MPLTHSNLELETSQMRPRAPMHTGTEGDVPIALTPEIDLVRTLVDDRVEVDLAQQHPHALAGVYRTTATTVSSMAILDTDGTGVSYRSKSSTAAEISAGSLWS
jgi:hypothetical protein